MAFRLPSFNLSCSLWRAPNVFANPADNTFAVNLSPGRRQLETNFGGTLSILSRSFTIEILCPKLTDIAGMVGAAALDMVEIPTGSGRCYAVFAVEDVAKGFANEYRLALAIQMVGATQTLTTNPWGAPIWPIPTP